MFFGRTHESRDLFSLMVAHRALIVYAQSGAGKTSLIHAGLMPILETEGFRALAPVRLGVVSPRAVPASRNVFSLHTLCSWAGEDVTWEGLGEHTLTQYLSSKVFTAADQTPRVALFDQFEELFSSQLEYWHHRPGFFEELAQALSDHPLLRVLLILREDYVAQLDPYLPLVPSRYRGRFRLDRMREDAALDAITQPLVETGVQFEEGVAEQLVEELLKERVHTGADDSVEIRGEFVEPVQLQVVCQSLWSQGLTRITGEHLRSVGNIDRALSEFYDRAIQTVSENGGLDEMEVRTWCEEELITPMGTRGTVYRSAETAKGLPITALEALENQHLIRGEWRAGARWYELTHDRFIDPIRASNRFFLQRHSERLAEAQRVFFDGYQSENRKESEQAIALYWRALSLFAELSDRQGQLNVLMSLAQLYGQLEDYEKQVELFTRAMDDVPEARGDIIPQRAAANWYHGQYAEADRDYTEALRDHPEDPGLLSGRGQVRAEMGEYREAIEDFKLVINSPDVPIAVLAYASSGLGLAYGGLGKYGLSADAFKRSLALEPHNAWAYYNRAVIHEGRGDMRRAAADYRMALKKTGPRLNPHKRKRATEWLAQRRSGPRGRS